MAKDLRKRNNFFRRILQRSKNFAVFFADESRNFHAVISDEIVNQFQSVKEGFFVERLSSEVVAYLVKDFFVVDPCEIELICFYFVVFLKAGHGFQNEADAC